jgi:hypothetical protein
LWSPREEFKFQIYFPHRDRFRISCHRVSIRHVRWPIPTTYYRSDLIPPLLRLGCVLVYIEFFRLCHFRNAKTAFDPVFGPRRRIQDAQVRRLPAVPDAGPARYAEQIQRPKYRVGMVRAGQHLLHLDQYPGECERQILKPVCEL